MGALAHEDVTDLFAALGVEDRVQLLDNLPAEIADQVMSGLDEEERESTNALMGYERGTVGRHMSPDVLVVEPADGVEGVVDKLKAEAENLETIYTLPVVDEDRVLIGITGLKDLFAANSGATIGDIMHEPAWAEATDDAEGLSLIHI